MTELLPSRLNASKSIAVVIGGGDNVYADAINALALIEQRKRTYFVINDMISRWQCTDFAVTLHPEKLDKWLADRATAGLPNVGATVSHYTTLRAPTTYRTKDWLGSSGLLAAKFAIECGHKAIILCGVPMTPTNHFLRQQPWHDFYVFRAAWKRHLNAIAPYVRSFDGWTAELLGEPSEAWLAARLDAEPVTPRGE